MTSPDPTSMARLLAALRYPCDRPQLVRQAASHGADDDLIGHLCTLPDRTFADARAVHAAFGQCG